jgi:quercetin dioxygenase-like cupin family protein
MKIVRLNDVKKVPVETEGADGAFKQLPIGSSDGAPIFSMRVFTVEPGGHTPFHAHPWEHENYVIEGEGVLCDASGNEYPIRRGDFAIVLPDEKHCYKNRSGDRALVLICAVPKENE